jgi:Putative transposase
MKTQWKSTGGRYTHRVAIANGRIKALDDDGVTFIWKDYRQGGAAKLMRLKPDEFIRRFLLHALPDGFHRIRHFGLLANGHRARRLALCRSLLADKTGPMANGEEERSSTDPSAIAEPPPCSECGGAMRFIAHVPRGCDRPDANAPPFWCETSMSPAMASAAIIVPNARTAVPIIAGDQKNAGPRPPATAARSQKQAISRQAGRRLTSTNRPTTRLIVAPEPRHAASSRPRLKQSP